MAKVVISVVVLAVLYYQWSWDLPEDSILRRSLDPVRPHLRRWGFGHSWKLYAPRPPSGTGEMRFEITGRDGAHYSVPFPLESFGPGWGRPATRINKARQSLGRGRPGYRRSLSRWLVDEHLPQGPAHDRDWKGPARVQCIMVRHRPPPLHDLTAAPPPPSHRMLFDITLPAP